MVVCHCEAINDAVIRGVLDEAGCPVDVDDIAERCGAGSACGGCHGSIRRVIERHLHETGVSLAAAR